MQVHATARYVRTSAQKAKLVLDIIRGRDVNAALATLKFARKSVARDIEKVLRSAIANAQQQDAFGGDVDQLYVSACYADQGPSMKRVRPAPMGRAFRVLKRTTHLTVRVTERRQVVMPEAATADADAPTPTRPARRTTPRGSTGAKRRRTTKGKTASGQ